jgi:hypothetical protein
MNVAHPAAREMDLFNFSTVLIIPALLAA